MNQKERTDYKRAFNEKAYDRLAITVPKGRKADIEAYANKNWRNSSVNGFVNDLIQAQLGMTDEEWKKGAGHDD